MSASRFASRLALGASIATFLLVVLGGLVHVKGASLACPDWPLCFGQFFPEMVGGVLYEHGHRLLALFVVTAVTGLSVVLIRDRAHDRTLARAGLFAVGLLAVQALLGGLTVLFKLVPAISVAHLGVSQLLLALLVFVWIRSTHPAPGPDPRAALALSLLILQAVLGAIVRHSGSALACGLEFPTCTGAFFPQTIYGWIHFVHRFAGLTVALAVPLLLARLRTSAARPLVFAIVILLAGQVMLGILTVLAGATPLLRTAHLATGALLTALVALVASRGWRGASYPPRGAQTEAKSTRSSDAPPAHAI